MSTYATTSERESVRAGTVSPTAGISLCARVTALAQVTLVRFQYSVLDEASLALDGERHHGRRARGRNYRPAPGRRGAGRSRVRHGPGARHRACRPSASGPTPSAAVRAATARPCAEETRHEARHPHRHGQGELRRPRLPGRHRGWGLRLRRRRRATRDLPRHSRRAHRVAQAPLAAQGPAPGPAAPVARGRDARPRGGGGAGNGQSALPARCLENDTEDSR